MCISRMGFENSVHKFLHVGQTSSVAHRNNVKHLLTAMCKNSGFPFVSFAYMSLVEHFLQVNDRFSWLTFQGFDDVILEQQWV